MHVQSIFEDCEALQDSFFLSLAGYCQTFSCFCNNVASFVASPQMFMPLPGMFQGPRIEARIEESQAGTPLWNHPVVSCTTSFFQTCLKRLAMEVTRTETQKTEVEVWLGNGSNEELPPFFLGGKKRSNFASPVNPGETTKS